MVQVSGKAETIRFFFFEVISQDSNNPFSTYHCNMEILVKSLGSAEPGGIGSPEIHITCGVETNIYPGGKDYVIYQVVLIRPDPCQKSPPVIAPFVLKVYTDIMNDLTGVRIVSQRPVVQPVVVVFHAGNKLGRHKPQTLPFAGILQSGNHSHILSGPVSTGILSGPVITLSVNVLHGSKHIQPVAVVRREEIVRNTSAMNLVFGLFCNVSFMRGTIQRIASPSVFSYPVILQSNF